MDFGLLGPLRVREGTRQVFVSAPRQRVLLAALLLRAGRVDSLGYAHQQLGNHAESVTWYQRALDLYDEIGHHCGYAETLGRLGDAHLAAGDLPKARAA